MGKEEEAKLGLDQLTREIFVKWHPPPWSLNASPLWTVRLSLIGGSNGGSAAIATTGPVSEPTLVHSYSRKGNKLTSSFETEVMALHLSTEWLAEQGDGGFTIICSDSQAVLSALNGSCISDRKGLAVVRSNLAQSNRRILLQWVPGHCGLIGNEWADAAAGEAATTVTPPTKFTSRLSANIRRLKH